MKGVTLLETVVVIALIAILSLFGINTINNFKRDAILDNTANELVSEMRVARSKSMNGEILDCEKYENFDPDGLPVYGISISGNSYESIRKYVKVGGISCDIEPKTVFLDGDLSLAPVGSIYFERITGRLESSNDAVITLSDKGVERRKINISKDFAVIVENIR